MWKRWKWTQKPREPWAYEGHTIVILGVQIWALDLSPEQIWCPGWESFDESIAAEGARSSEAPRGSGWCRSFACSMGNTEKKDYIYLKTIASRKISWLIIRFSIKIAIRLGAPCAQPPLVFANFRRRAKIATLESAPLLHPRNGSDLWITSERKRSIIVKGICVQGFWPNCLRCFWEYRKWMIEF